MRVTNFLDAQQYFPYYYGYLLALENFASGGAFAGQLDRFPLSTAQVMNAAKYAAFSPPTITGIEQHGDLTKTALGKPIYADTMGRFFVESAIAFNMDSGKTASWKSAAEWVGDRVAVFGTGHEKLIVWEIQWAAEGAAREFENVFKRAAANIAQKVNGSKLRISRKGTRTLILDGADDKQTALASDALGM